ncbi:hypothetical protein vseg_007202 [Gypsophila vaccaria]
MQPNANIEGDTLLQEDVPPSLFASVSAVEEVVGTLLRMNGGNEPTKEREPDKVDRGVQSHLNDSNSKNVDEREGLEEQEKRSHSDIRDLEDAEMKRCMNSQEKEDEEMSNANIEGDTSLQEDVPPSLFASVSAVEEEVTRTLLCMNGGNEPTEKESSRKNAALSAPRACTSASTTKGYEGDCATTNFEGFDIRSGLVPTLIKIWGKHGNIIENSTIHSCDLIARALELLATMVQILESNSVESLSDCQADYLSSTLSDLKIMSFNVDWLSSFVEKAVKLRKRKALVDSLNKLGQLSSQVEESRAMLLDKLAKLTEEENKLKKEMAKVSKAIPFSDQVKFDEPLGLGLT